MVIKFAYINEYVGYLQFLSDNDLLVFTGVYDMFGDLSSVRISASSHIVQSAAQNVPRGHGRWMDVKNQIIRVVSWDSSYGSIAEIPFTIDEENKIYESPY